MHQITANGRSERNLKTLSWYQVETIDVKISSLCSFTAETGGAARLVLRWREGRLFAETRESQELHPDRRSASKTSYRPACDLLRLTWPQVEEIDRRISEMISRSVLHGVDQVALELVVKKGHLRFVTLSTTEELPQAAP